MAEKKFAVREVLKAAETAEKSGQLELAAGYYSRVFARFPNHSTAGKKLKRLHKKLTGATSLTQNDVNQLVAMLQSGNFDTAVDTANRLICIEPREPVLYNFLGIALSRMLQKERAEKAFRNAIRLRPDYAEALGNLGTILRELEKPEEAISTLAKALKLNPNIIEANNSMALLLCQTGRPQESLEFTGRALASNPNYLSAYNTKGLALKDMDRLEDAIATFEDGLKIDPDNTDILINLAYTYSNASRQIEAVAFLEKALEVQPNLGAEPVYRLAVMLAQNGETERAREVARRAIDKAPDQAEPYRFVSTIKKFKPDDPEIAEMEALFARSKGSPGQQKHLGFALGKAFEDVGEPVKAFSYWKVGNELRRNDFSYDIQEDRDRFQRVRDFFSREFFTSYNGERSDSDQPIFVVGMMRSGTTLVEQILSSHSQVFGAGEIDYFYKFARDWYDAGGNSSAEFDTLIDGYQKRILREVEQSPRVVDKMPMNFLCIGFIKAVFPKAKIINLVRDPRDVGLSIFKNYFDADGNPFAYDLKELAEFYLLYREMISHWHQVLPGAVYDISYESVVADLEGEARKALSYCELDWEENVLSFQKTERVVRTASLDQVRKPIYSSSVKGWKRFEEELQPFIQILEKANALPD